MPRSLGSPEIFTVLARDASTADVAYWRLPESQRQPYARTPTPVPQPTKRLSIQLQLGTPRRFDVDVVDHEDRPLSDVRVGLTAFPIVQAAKTDAAGRARFLLPKAQLIDSVVAFAGGMGVEWSRFSKQVNNRTVSLTAAELSERVRLKLTGAKSVRIQLQDETGAPWIGIPVLPTDLERPSDKPRIIPESFYLQDIGCLFDKKTDQQGVVTLDWLPDWQTRPWRFRLPNGHDFAPTTFEIDSKQSLSEPVVIRAPRLVTIEGHVTDADGKPVPDAYVSASGAHYEIPSFGTSTKTEADGRYRLKVAPDCLYLLYSYHKERKLAGMRDGFVVRPGNPHDEMDLSILPMARIYGRVTIGAEAKPFANRKMSFTLLGRELSQLNDLSLPNPGKKQSLVQPRYSFGGEIDAEGNYEVFAGPGTYTLSPIEDSFRYPNPLEVKFAVTDTTPREQNFHVEDPRAHKLIGKVVAGDSPMPVGLANVQMMSRSPRAIQIGWSRTTTRFDGVFEIDRPTQPTQPTQLYASSQDGKFAGLLELKPNQAEVTLVLKPTATVTVRLVDAVQRPLPPKTLFEWGVRFDLADLGPGTQLSSTLYGSKVETDGEGRLTLKNMLVGVEYELNRSVGKDQWLPASKIVVDRSGEQTWPKDLVIPAP